MRNLIRKILKEEFFQEDAKRAEALSEHVALFVTEVSFGYELTLFDPNSDNILGTITFNLDENEGPYHYVTGVAAKKGFGPFMYELAMMHIDNSGGMLMPSRDGDVRGSAWNVWKKFYERSDVDKKTIDLLDEYFRCDLIVGSPCYFESTEEKQEWWNEFSDDEKMDLLVFNTGYSMEPNNDYYQLIKNSDKYPKEVKDKVNSYASELWDEMY